MRELRQAVRKAAIFARSERGPINTAVLQEATRSRKNKASPRTIEFDPLEDAWNDVVDRAWGRYVQLLLRVCGNNKTLAAKKAGLSRSAFLAKLAKHRNARNVP